MLTTLLPWLLTAPAVAGPRRQVKKAFSAWVAASHAFDPVAVAGSYHPDAVVRASRTRADGGLEQFSLDGQQLQEILPKLMVTARELDDRDTFADVRFTAEAGGWRVEAVRTSHYKCYDDSGWSQLWTPGDDGVWRIQEERLNTRELSTCPGAGTPLAQVLEIQRRALGDQVPIRIDEITTMTGVEVVGESLVYRVTLGMAAADLDLAAFGGAFSAIATQNSCVARDTRLVLDLGGTLVVMVSDPGGAPITEARTQLSDCEGAVTPGL